MAMVSASSAAAKTLTLIASAATETTESRIPIASASKRRHDAARNWAHRRPRHIGVDIGVPPHVERAAGPCPSGHRRERRDELHPVHRRRRKGEADCAGEDHERHDPGLEQNKMIDDAVPRPRRGRVTGAILTRNCRRSNGHSGSPKVARQVGGAFERHRGKRAALTSTIIATTVDRKSDGARALSEVAQGLARHRQKSLTSPRERRLCARGEVSERARSTPGSGVV